jgi:hypothetical protein
MAVATAAIMDALLRRCYAELSTGVYVEEWIGVQRAEPTRPSIW